MVEENSNVSDLNRADVGELKTEMRAVKAEIAGVKAEVAGLRVDLGEVRSQLHELAEYTQAGFKAVLAQGDRRFLEDHAGFTPPR